MKITLINGNPGNSNSSFQGYIKRLENELAQVGIESTCFNLRDKAIVPCTGCWGCWVKTPGECKFDDITKLIRKEVIRSDWVLFLSPVIMGFTSALLKKVQDKFIPLVHPYIELVNNECHHEKRYEQYPKIGLIYAPDEQTDHEDLDIIHNIYRRFALNFKTEFKIFRSIEEPLETLTHEIVAN